MSHVTDRGSGLPCGHVPSRAFDVADLDALFDLIDPAAFGHLVTKGQSGFDSTGSPVRSRSQNRSEADRAVTTPALATSPNLDDQAVADVMRGLTDAGQ